MFYYLKYLSIFFLGCETISILQWSNITFIRTSSNDLQYHDWDTLYIIRLLIVRRLFFFFYVLACLDVSNCLHNGMEVLLSYGYDINRFNTDLVILGSFYIISYIVGYYGLLRRTKQQPAYWFIYIYIYMNIDVDKSFILLNVYYMYYTHVYTYRLAFYPIISFIHLYTSSYSYASPNMI